MILPSAFSRLAVRAAAILSPPSDIAAIPHRRAAKSAFRVLRHLQESGAFAGARRKSAAPCCAVRRFPPRRRYISHPNSRQLSAFVFCRARISFGIYRCRIRHCRTRKRTPRGIRGKSFAAAGFFCRCGGTPVAGFGFAAGRIHRAAGRSQIGIFFADRQFIGIFFADLPAARAAKTARAASARKRFSAIRRIRACNAIFGIFGAFAMNVLPRGAKMAIRGGCGKNSAFISRGESRVLQVAVLFAGFRTAPPKAAAGRTSPLSGLSTRVHGWKSQYRRGFAGRLFADKYGDSPIRSQLTAGIRRFVRS